ncbi:hypothetical protein ACYTFC_13555 [Streptomyces globosus]
MGRHVVLRFVLVLVLRVLLVLRIVLVLVLRGRGLRRRQLTRGSCTARAERPAAHGSRRAPPCPSPGRVKRRGSEMLPVNT